MRQEDVRRWIKDGPAPEIINAAKKFGEQIKKILQ